MTYLSLPSTAETSRASKYAAMLVSNEAMNDRIDVEVPHADTDTLLLYLAALAVPRIAYHLDPDKSSPMTRSQLATAIRNTRNRLHRRNGLAPSVVTHLFNQAYFATKAAIGGNEHQHDVIFRRGVGYRLYTEYKIEPTDALMLMELSPMSRVRDLVDYLAMMQPTTKDVIAYLQEMAGNLNPDTDPDS